MKTLFVAAVALASVIGAPVSAQEMSQSKLVVNPNEARASIEHRGAVRHSSNPAYDVYDTNGNYVGSDPDPQVRLNLRDDSKDN